MRQILLITEDENELRISMDGENIDLLMGVMQVLKEMEKNTNKTVAELCDFIKENAYRL